MDKTTKRALFIALSIVGVIIAVLAVPIYFASQISATFPHLKDYEYTMTAKQLEADIIKTLASDPCFKYCITDSTGTKRNRRYYMTIELKFDNDSLSFHITYSDSDRSSCNLGLVGVFDKTNGSGGYKDEDKDVEKLIGIFDNQLIDKLSRRGH